MSIEPAHSKSDLFFDELEVDVTGTIEVMICRMWDVNTIIGRYLSTDFVVSDAKGNVIHCTARGNIAHNFLRLKEGGIYSIKNFVVLPNKEEYRIIKNDVFMLEFDGGTTIRKDMVKPDGFLRHPFQLVDFDTIEPTNNKYLIGQSSKKQAPGLLISTSPIIDKLYLSSSSSTIILDDDEIPALKELKKEISGYRLELGVSDDTAHAVVVMFDETAANLVKCSAESILEVEDMSSDNHSSLPPAIANTIGTTHVLELKSHTYYEYGSYESFTCWKINLAHEVEECSSTVGAAPAIQAPSLKRLSKNPSVSTPLKPTEGKKNKRVVIEDSDTEAASVSAEEASEGKASCPSDIKKKND
ncbi:hypothetical protein OROHE_002693 [Orobanche hederae]